LKQSRGEKRGTKKNLMGKQCKGDIRLGGGAKRRRTPGEKAGEPGVGGGRKGCAKSS